MLIQHPFLGSPSSRKGPSSDIFWGFMCCSGCTKLFCFRNLQVYNLTIRQFGALQSIAPNMHQMGYRYVCVSVLTFWTLSRQYRVASICKSPSCLWCCLQGQGVEREPPGAHSPPAPPA